VVSQTFSPLLGVRTGKEKGAAARGWRGARVRSEAEVEKTGGKRGVVERLMLTGSSRSLRVGVGGRKRKNDESVLLPAMR
jgi:hypothetical protein